MGSQISTNDFRGGIKVEMDNQPYVIISNEFVKPGKGQAFNRVRLKHLISGRTVDRTFKSGDKLEIADVVETEMRLLYREQDGIIFMDEKSFEQIKIPHENIGEAIQWMLEDLVYGILIYKGQPISVEPPTFMEMRITRTDPGVVATQPLAEFSNQQKPKAALKSKSPFLLMKAMSSRLILALEIMFLVLTKFGV